MDLASVRRPDRLQGLGRVTEIAPWPEREVLQAQPTDLTVVIPTVGRPILAECLNALAEGTTRPAHVVIVDQSRGGTMLELIEAARSLGVDVVHVESSQRGPAAARNRGLERVTTRFVAAIDDDCCPAPDWAERVLERLSAHPGAVITGRVESAAARELPSTMAATTSAVYHSPLRDRDPLFSGNMAVERRVFDQVGLFSEDPVLIPAAEDNEWGYRALRAGVPIVYAPECAVRHLDWRAPDELAMTYRRYARGQGGFYGLYLRRRDWFIARRAVRDLVRMPWLLARALMSRDRPLLIVARAQFSQLIPGIIAGLRSPGQRPATPDKNG
jgi:GT2 family glycosyltransferase